MRRDFKILGLTILMLISLFSVGFASWTISYSYTVSVDGSFEVNDAISSSEFIEIETVEVLQYTKSGFIGSDKTRDSLIISGTVNLDKCRLSFSSSSKIQIELKLSYSSAISTTYDIFSNIESVNAYQKLPIEHDLAINNEYNTNSYSISLSISPSIDEYKAEESFTFLISYNFKIDDINYFTDEASPLSKSNASLFKLSSVVSSL